MTATKRSRGWGSRRGPLRQRVRPLVAGDVLQDRVRARLLAHVRVHLVPVAERVDQPLGQGVGGQERPAVEQRARLFGGLAPPLGDGGGDLLGDRDGHAFGGLPGGTGEAALGQVVGGRLVLVPFSALEGDADLGQRVVQEQLLDGHAGEPERARRLQVDPVERGGQVVGHVAVGELAEGLGPGHGELARLAEVGNRLADLLHPGQPDPAAAHLDHERADPVVLARSPQALDHVGQTQLAPGHERGKRIRNRPLTDPVGQVELEDQRGRLALP